MLQRIEEEKVLVDMQVEEDKDVKIRADHKATARSRIGSARPRLEAAADCDKCSLIFSIDPHLFLFFFRCQCCSGIKSGSKISLILVRAAHKLKRSTAFHRQLRLRSPSLISIATPDDPFSLKEIFLFRLPRCLSYENQSYQEDNVPRDECISHLSGSREFDIETAIDRHGI